MAVANVYTLFSFDITSPAAAKFSRLTNFTVNGGLNVAKAFPAGLPYPMFTTIRGGAPGCSFSTPQIDTLFDVCLASTGNGYSADLSAGVNTMVFEKALAYGTRNTGSVHPNFVLSDPLLYWSRITASSGGVAEATVNMVMAYDGTNSPIVHAAGGATGVQVAAEEFGLGQVSINGTALDGVRSVTVESGVELITVGDESEIYPTFVGIRRCAPMVTIEMLDASYWGTIPLTTTSAGLALNGTTGLTIYYRARATEGGNSAASIHPKIIIANGLVEPVSVGGAAGSSMTMGLRVTARTATDTTPPLVPSVGNAHP